MRLLACMVAAASLVCAGQSLQQIFDDAVSALSQGDYPAAERGFQKVLETAPDHVDSLQNLGVVYARTNRVEQAITVYRRALDLKPANARVLTNLGLAYMKQKSFGPALPVFQTLFRVDPGNPSARDIRLLYPLTSGYLKQDSTEPARRAMNAFLAALPAESASLVLCKRYFENERFDQAEEQCRRTLAINPQLPGAHLELARVLAAQHHAQAAQELSNALREEPGDAESLYDLGVLLLQSDRLAECITYFERSMQLNPVFWGAYFHLGKVRLKLNQPELAVPLLRKAAELNPDSFPVFYELGRSLTATGKREEAARAMQRVRELRALQLEEEAKALRKR